MSFAGADLRDADLSRSRLDDANLFGADLRNAGLTLTSLRNASLRGAIHGPRTRWPQHLRDERLREARAAE